MGAYIASRCPPKSEGERVNNTKSILEQKIRKKKERKKEISFFFTNPIPQQRNLPTPRRILQG